MGEIEKFTRYIEDHFERTGKYPETLRMSAADLEALRKEIKEQGLDYTDAVRRAPVTLPRHQGTFFMNIPIQVVPT